MAKTLKKTAAKRKAPKKRTQPPKKRVTPVTLAKGIEFRPPRELKGFANNTKAHSLEQIDAIANSIKKFGFNAPILAGSDGTVIAGHARLAAALKLGLETVPVVVLDHLTEAQRRKYVIADNKLSEFGSSWDEDVLAKELAALKDDDFDLHELGFTDDELEDILPDLEDQADEILRKNPKREELEDDEPEPREPRDPAEPAAERGLEEDEEKEPKDKEEQVEIPVERIPAGVSGKSSEAEKEMIAAFDELVEKELLAGSHYDRFREAVLKWRSDSERVIK